MSLEYIYRLSMSYKHSMCRLMNKLNEVNIFNKYLFISY